MTLALAWMQGLSSGLRKVTGECMHAAPKRGTQKVIERLYAMSWMSLILIQRRRDSSVRCDSRFERKTFENTIL